MYAFRYFSALEFSLRKGILDIRIISSCHQLLHNIISWYPLMIMISSCHHVHHNIISWYPLMIIISSCHHVHCNTQVLTVSGERRYFSHYSNFFSCNFAPYNLMYLPILSKMWFFAHSEVDFSRGHNICDTSWPTYGAQGVWYRLPFKIF